MAMVHADGSSLEVDSEPKLVGLLVKNVEDDWQSCM